MLIKSRARSIDEEKKVRIPAKSRRECPVKSGVMARFCAAAVEVRAGEFQGA